MTNVSDRVLAAQRVTKSQPSKLGKLSLSLLSQARDSQQRVSFIINIRENRLFLDFHLIEEADTVKRSDVQSLDM